MPKLITVNDDLVEVTQFKTLKEATNQGTKWQKDNNDNPRWNSVPSDPEVITKSLTPLDLSNLFITFHFPCGYDVSIGVEGNNLEECIQSAFQLCEEEIEEYGEPNNLTFD